MSMVLGALCAIGYACAANGGVTITPSKLDSVRVIKSWEPVGDRAASPLAAVTADFNLDGKVDVVALTADESFISLGDGSGGFSSPIALPFTGSWLATGDFNDDAAPDLAFTRSDGVFIALGGGNAAFAPAVQAAASTSPSFVAVGDFNADSRADLVWRDAAGAHIALRAGSGVFAAPNLVTAATGDIVVGPIDSEPGDDLAIGASLFYANPDATFRFGPVIPADRVAALADMDGDGDTDLIYEKNGSAPEYSAALGIAQNVDAVFSLGRAEPLLHRGPHAVVVADFDGDGLPDLAAASKGAIPPGVLWMPGRHVTVFRGQRTSLEPLTSVMPGGAATDTLVVTDLNADSWPDLVVANRGSRHLYVPTGSVARYGRCVGAIINGPGADFRAPQLLIASPGANSSLTVVPCDFNGDSLTDVAIQVTESSQVRVHLRRNIGDGSFSQRDVYIEDTQNQQILPRFASLRQVEVGSAEQLVVTAGQGYTLRPDPSITPPDGYDQGLALRATAIAPLPTTSIGLYTRGKYIDIDGDGTLDLVQWGGRASTSTPGVRILLRRGDEYAEPIQLLEGQRIDGLDAGAFDGAPGTDLIVAIRGSVDAYSHIGREYTLVRLLNHSLEFRVTHQSLVGDGVFEVTSHPTSSKYIVSSFNSVRVAAVQGINTFSVQLLGVNFTPTGYPILDVNTDGRPDILAMSASPEFDGPAKLIAYPFLGDNFYAPITVTFLPWAFSSVQPVDLNNDTRQDLLATDARSRDIWIIRNRAAPPPAPCFGDVNRNRVVDAHDLSWVLASIQSGSVLNGSDLNADSLVDGRDLSILLANFGRTCP